MKQLEKIQLEKVSETQAMQQKHEQYMNAIHEEMSLQFSQIMVMIQQNPGLAHIKPELLSKKIKE
jgi:integrase/recombinase XerD